MRLGLFFAIVGTLSGCRPESHAAEPERPLAALDLVERDIAGLATINLPRGWHVSQGRYPSEHTDNQFHRMLRASFDRKDEDAGVLSIDVSPSHPRIWRKPLRQHVDARLRSLARLGDVQVVTGAESPPDLSYELEERWADVGSELQTYFRIFRQKSRVVTVAFTASPDRFDSKRASRLIHEVSDSVQLDLPIAEITKPDLRTETWEYEGLTSPVPRGWQLLRRRTDYTLVPTETLELAPNDTQLANDRPTLTLSVLLLSELGPGVRVDGLAVAPAGQEVPTGGGAHATVVQVDEDTLAAMRIIRIGQDVVTATYAAPDYLFEVGKALELLETIAEGVTLVH